MELETNSNSSVKGSSNRSSINDGDDSDTVIYNTMMLYSRDTMLYNTMIL